MGDDHEESEREESDQLREERPSEQVHEDEGEGRGAGREAEENAGVPDEGGQATGNPASAG